MKWLKVLLMSTLLSLSAMAAEPVNINTADAKSIATSLTGVGLSIAQRIVEYREANGEFKHPDELVKVKGIGLKTINKNRDLILVAGAAKKKS